MNSLYECELCPRNCLADRSCVEGYCRSGLEIKISSWDLHFGEESCLSGTSGSGTIFFTNCNLRCVFCQNHTISQSGIGNQISTEDLVEIILKLQDLGVHNINLVTPTHFSSQLVEVLIKAKDQGLKIPVIWNSNAYEKVETLKQMVELVDIYLPDLKYLIPENAARYSDAGDYPQFVTAAVLEMHNQVGRLKLDSAGIAVKGLLVRHLVLPDNPENTRKVINWIAANLPNDTCLNLMSQYYPAWKAAEYPELTRRIYREEYLQAKQYCLDAGLKNVLWQN